MKTPLSTLPLPLDECCAPLAQEPLDAESAETLATRMKALADPSRLRVLSLIATQPSGELCVCDFTAPLGLSQGTISHHVRVLLDAGLLMREKRGTNVYYRTAPGALASLATLIST
jgi:ArsR family transcriptional regulator